jgi:hypothetical protein
MPHGKPERWPKACFNHVRKGIDEMVKHRVTYKLVARYFPSGNLTIKRDAGYLIHGKQESGALCQDQDSREKQVSKIEYA